MHLLSSENIVVVKTLVKIQTNGPLKPSLALLFYSVLKYNLPFLCQQCN